MAMALGLAPSPGFVDSDPALASAIPATPVSGLPLSRAAMPLSFVGKPPSWGATSLPPLGPTTAPAAPPETVDPDVPADEPPEEGPASGGLTAELPPDPSGDPEGAEWAPQPTMEDNTSNRDSVHVALMTASLRSLVVGLC
jgi:hypothetical protein